MGLRAQASDPRVSAPPSPATEAVLLVDGAATPRVSVSWPREDVEPVLHERSLPYASASEKVTLGDNVAAYVAGGGTRIDRGQAHPDGATIRVGFYKVDPGKPFFDGLAQDAVIEVRLENVTFNQPVHVPHGAILQHVQFTQDELIGCGLPGASRNQFNTADPRDTHTGRLSDADSRRGVVRVRTVGAEPVEGDAVPSIEPDTERWLSDPAEIIVRHDGARVVTLIARLPYALLRHIEDPWRVTSPGTFQEPSHFHLEFEVLPMSATAKAPNTGRRPPLPPPARRPDDER